MPHNFKNIYGHFNFELVYDEQVSNAQNNSHFLEIGCFLGKSTVYLAELIKESGKNITLHVIDTFEGEGNTESTENFYEQFLDNIKKYNVNDIIKVYSGTSDYFSTSFNDKFFDFIYIDGLHTYDGVCSDIKNYLNKLKCGKTLAGHDYQYDPVKTAVNESLGEKNLSFYNNTWKYIKIC